MKRCRDCEHGFVLFGWVFNYCNKTMVTNRATGQLAWAEGYSRAKGGTEDNNNGKCQNYVRKWWKFWRSK